MNTSHPRIGCVPYLNARPLLEGLEGIAPTVRKLVPAMLYDAYEAGELDAALLSSIDVIGMEKAEVVNGVSISSRGDVHSVVMAYTGELRGVTKVALDPASHTSNALLRIVLEEFHGIRPEYVQYSEEESNKDARLMIGDPAISFRKEAMGSVVRFLDLGGEWFRYTGLPFVFAVWSLKPSYTEKEELSELLRMAKSHGLANRPAIAALAPDPDFTLRYLIDSIRYDLGEEEKRGLALFQEFLTKLNIVLKSNSKISYY